MKNFSKASWSLTLAGATLLLITVIAAWGNLEILMRSYLFAFLFWCDLPLGAMALIMIYHLTGGNWGAVSRRGLEAISATLGVNALFSVPVLIGVSKIYSWTQPGVAAEPKILHKHLYLNPTSFAIRTILYFAGWLTINYFLRRWSESEGRQRVQSTERARLGSLSAAGLVFFGFSVTFAGIDWQMSVEPKWYSTVYGMVFAIGQALTAYSLALAVLGAVAVTTGLAPQINKKALRDLGNILLVLVMLWAYLSFMQYLVIWSGNLPHEVTWLNQRMTGGWQWVALFLILFQFAAPFCLLLFRSTKDEMRRLAILGALVFFVRVVDHYWMLVPGFGYRPLDLPLTALGIWSGLGLIWFAVFLKKIRLKPLFAKDDLDWPSPVTEGNLKKTGSEND